MDNSHSASSQPGYAAFHGCLRIEKNTCLSPWVSGDTRASIPPRLPLPIRLFSYNASNAWAKMTRTLHMSSVGGAAHIDRDDGHLPQRLGFRPNLLHVVVRYLCKDGLITTPSTEVSKNPLSFLILQSPHILEIAKSYSPYYGTYP